MEKEQTIAKEKAKSRRVGRSIARELAQIALTVALIAVCAWTTVPVFFIPFTLQTFAVAFAGALLGWKRGTIAVGVYILMGLIGIPVFSGFKAGAAALFGSTGGFFFWFFFFFFFNGVF